MTTKILITGVEALPQDHRLDVTFDNGKRLAVDLSDIVRRFVVLRPLLDADRFRRVAVGEWGFDLDWGDDIELAATTVYRLAMEQAGEVMPMADFKRWMADNHLSLTDAARELGLSRRTITGYSSGASLIPKHIALACKGWEYLHGKAA